MAEALWGIKWGSCFSHLQVRNSFWHTLREKSRQHKSEKFNCEKALVRFGDLSGTWPRILAACHLYPSSVTYVSQLSFKLRSAEGTTRKNWNCTAGIVLAAWLNSSRPHETGKTWYMDSNLHKQEFAFLRGPQWQRAPS